MAACSPTPIIISSPSGAADCVEHVLHLFEQERPDDDRPRRAIELARAWTRGEVPMKVCHSAAFEANAAGRAVTGAAREAALAAGQAVAVAQRLRNELCWFVFDC